MKPHGPRDTSAKKVTANMKADTQHVSLGEMAGLVMTMAMVRKRLGRHKKKKVPNMLYEHLK